MQGATPQVTYPQSLVQAQTCVAGKGPGGLNGHQAELDLAVHHCSKECKAYPGLHPHGHCRQGQKLDHPTLLYAFQATPGLMCPVLLPAIKKKKNCEQLKSIQIKAIKMIKDSRTSWRKTEGLCFFCLEKIRGTLSQVLIMVLRKWLQWWGLSLHKKTEGHKY